MSATMYTCSKCNFQTIHFFKLISHYRFVHSHEQGFSLLCPNNECQKEYSNVDSLIKHIKRKHKHFHQLHLARFREQNRVADILNDLIVCHEEINCDDIDTCDHDHFLNLANAGQTQVDFQRKYCIFLVQLREKFKLPSNAIPHIVSESISMICHHQAHFSQSINRFIQETALDPADINRLKQIVEEQSEVENALDGLDSDYKLNKFIKQNFNFVKPVEFRPNRHTNDTYQYVPILETLKNLLSHDDVFSFVVNSHRSVDGVLRDFCDGDLHNSNTLFQRDQSAFQIILFFDEFTAVNPIGHQVKNYKIGGFYMLLGNLPPKFRSKLYVIQLVMLCLSSTLKNNGFEKIMEPLIHDLRLLETEGLVINKDEMDHRLYGTVSVVAADNLGAHGIGGYMESFNTLRNCRFCFISKQNMQTNFDSQKFNMRTVEMYNEQCRLVEVNPELANVYGIKGNSPLNQLDYYHVINGLPADLAHDLFEGVVGEVMTNVIKYCVREEYFNLEYLNDQIKSFRFSNVDKSNKPSKVQTVLSKFNVRQSAAQMWCLARHLPLLIGEKVPENDPKWETFLQLRDVLFYVCAPALDQGHILSMADVIEEFHLSYRECFPDITVKPKFHFTLHYPHLTKLFGPLIHLQTIRFEGKHNYFKELVYRTKNKKNICKSLADRHQYYQCTFSASSNFLSDSRIESSGGSVVPLCMLNDNFQQSLRGILQGEDVFLCDSVTVFGITYWKNTCVIRGLHGFLLQFSKIDHCTVVSGTPYLLCRKLTTLDFERHFHAFAVRDTEECEMVKVSDLIDPNPLGIYDHPICDHHLVTVKSKVLL